MRSVQALVFDFDGILVDSEPLHYRAYQEVLAPLGLGYAWADYTAKYMGSDDRDALRERFRDAGQALEEGRLAALIQAKAEAFQRLAASVTPQPYPGVVDLVQSASSLIPVGLCSGALRRDIAPILKALALDDNFHILVTADDVHVSKPDPASYRLAVERLRAAFPRLDLKPYACVAIEDTPAGIAAARGAGLKVLALTNSYPGDQLGGANKVLSSLAGVNLDDLEELF